MKKYLSSLNKEKLISILLIIFILLLFLIIIYYYKTQIILFITKLIRIHDLFKKYAECMHEEEKDDKGSKEEKYEKNKEKEYKNSENISPMKRCSSFNPYTSSYILNDGLEKDKKSRNSPVKKILTQERIDYTKEHYESAKEKIKWTKDQLKFTPQSMLAATLGATFDVSQMYKKNPNMGVKGILFAGLTGTAKGLSIDKFSEKTVEIAPQVKKNILDNNNDNDDKNDENDKK